MTDGLVTLLPQFGGGCDATNETDASIIMLTETNASFNGFTLDPSPSRFELQRVGTGGVASQGTNTYFSHLGNSSPGDHTPFSTSLPAVVIPRSNCHQHQQPRRSVQLTTSPQQQHLLQPNTELRKRKSVTPLSTLCMPPSVCQTPLQQHIPSVVVRAPPPQGVHEPLQYLLRNVSPEVMSSFTDIVKAWRRYFYFGCGLVAVYGIKRSTEGALGTVGVMSRCIAVVRCVLCFGMTLYVVRK